jgi:hypothetical protein
MRGPGRTALCAVGIERLIHVDPQDSSHPCENRSKWQKQRQACINALHQRPLHHHPDQRCEQRTHAQSQSVRDVHGAQKVSFPRARTSGCKLNIVHTSEGTTKQIGERFVRCGNEDRSGVGSPELRDICSLYHRNLPRKNVRTTLRSGLRNLNARPVNHDIALNFHFD